MKPDPRLSILLAVPLALVVGLSPPVLAAGGFANIHAHGVFPAPPTVTTPPGWTCGGFVTPTAGDIVCTPPPDMQVFCQGWSVAVTDTISGLLVPLDAASVTGMARCNAAPWAACTAPLPAVITLVPPFSSTNSCFAAVHLAAPPPIECAWTVTPPAFALDTLTYDVDCNYF